MCDVKSNLLVLIDQYAAKIMPSRKEYTRNAYAGNANGVPDHEVWNVDFQNVIQLFAQRVTNKNNHKFLFLLIEMVDEWQLGFEIF